jgi:hypothetical protein
LHDGNLASALALVWLRRRHGWNLHSDRRILRRAVDRLHEFFGLLLLLGERTQRTPVRRLKFVEFVLALELNQLFGHLQSPLLWRLMLK